MHGVLAQATPQADRKTEPLLAVDDLRTCFDLRHGVVNAVAGVSFALAPHETLAIVGESGCGKSITALSLMRLVPDPPGRIVGGSVRLADVDLLALDEETMRTVRGKDVAMIFQEPMTSLNPVLSIGAQISETVELHQDLSKAAAWEKAVEMLRRVRIPEPAQRATEYPHQLSGGMPAGTGGRLKEIPGVVPPLYRLPAGCVFAPRCPLADDKCRALYPPFEQKRPGHWAACWHSDELAGAAP